MSYTVSFFLIDIEKLRSVIGGKDLSIVDKIDVDEENRSYLEALLLGSESGQDDDSSEYGYALEKIVEHLFGESEAVPEFEDLRYGEFDNPPLDWILQSGSPVKLPPIEDFPYVGHRTIAEMRNALDSWDDEKYDDFEPEIQEMIEGMFSVFQTAIEKKKDLITFYY
ncbi:MAG: hypothetical protein LBU65_09290 [Planctomycetaceae bacterium]|jgi:hypothetical protein|nr:hypothetical protein [Planctomycetaceae bacterium]